MKETACHSFFLNPTTTLHRRYEALRAIFVERRTVKEIAEHFGYGYGTLRNLVHEFRTQWAAQQVPPFSRNRALDARSTSTPASRAGARNSRPRLIVAS